MVNRCWPLGDFGTRPPSKRHAPSTPSVVLPLDARRKLRSCEGRLSKPTIGGGDNHSANHPRITSGKRPSLEVFYLSVWRSPQVITPISGRNGPAQRATSHLPPSPGRHAWDDSAERRRPHLLHVSHVQTHGGDLRSDSGLGCRHGWVT